jgi:hypothetical protein
VTTARTVIWRLIVKVVPSAMFLKSQSQGSQPMVLRSTGRTEPQADKIGRHRCPR